MIDEAKKHDVLRRAVSTYGELMQTDILIEEMSELTKAIIKVRRHGWDRASTDVLEELVDVQICVDELKIILEKNYQCIGSFLDLYDQMIMQKVARLENRLDGKEVRS